MPKAAHPRPLSAGLLEAWGVDESLGERLCANGGSSRDINDVSIILDLCRILRPAQKSRGILREARKDPQRRKYENCLRNTTAFSRLFLKML